MDKIYENNIAQICGTVDSDFVYSHEVYGEKFFEFTVRVERLSGTADLIPVIVSERLFDIGENLVGKAVCVEGQFRSYNEQLPDRMHLKLTFFAMDISAVSENTCDLGENSIFLDGYVCKKPTYRETPMGREISDFILAVNRPYGKSDYIPCLLWGRNARFSQSFEPGKHIKVWGRIQSREFLKRLSETEFENRIAYEVSVSKVEEVEDAEKSK